MKYHYCFPLGTATFGTPYVIINYIEAESCITCFNQIA